MRDKSILHRRQQQFGWDYGKAATNAPKHGISFDLARTVFNDPHLLTVADLEHGETEQRWFSIGRATNGSMLSVAYLWTSVSSVMTKVDYLWS
jgi:uncharacterized protein